MLASNGHIARILSSRGLDDHGARNSARGRNSCHRGWASRGRASSCVLSRDGSITGVENRGLDDNSTRCGASRWNSLDGSRTSRGNSSTSEGARYRHITRILRTWSFDDDSSLVGT